MQSHLLSHIRFTLSDHYDTLDCDMNNANFTQPNYNVITSVPKEIFVVVSSADISLCLLVANIT